jgi:cobalamin biosynthesis protein CobD/CbiB
MKKTKVNSILWINSYLIGCKLRKPGSYTTELARKCLTKEIESAISDPNVKEGLHLSIKQFMFLMLLFLMDLT